MRGHIQPSLGGDLFPLFRHKGDHVRSNGQGDLHHLLGRCHLQVQTGAHRLTQQLHITVLDVTAILPQMNRDAIGTAEFGKHGERHRIRFHRPACLANIGDVVDVDPEAGHTNVCLSRSYAGRTWL